MCRTAANNSPPSASEYLDLNLRLTGGLFSEGRLCRLSYSFLFIGESRAVLKGGLQKPSRNREKWKVADGGDYQGGFSTQGGPRLTGKQ